MNLARRDALKKIGVGAVAGATLSAGNVLQSFAVSDVQTDRINEYSWVRGFNYQPSWGCKGIQIWNDFRESTFVHEVDLGLRLFPKLNVLRIWFSFDAYISNRLSFLAAAKQASAILSERNLKMISQLKILGKPVIATECCWGSNDDAIRVNYIRNDLDLLKKAGIGFLPHGLHHSFVADLHRPISGRNWDTMYMGFIDPNGLIRPGHEIYNEY